MSKEKKDYYKILEVEKTATKDEIKKAYKVLAKKHHPDLNKDDADAQKRFQEINEAYSVLSDEKKKKYYDQYGSSDDPFAHIMKFYGFVDDDGHFEFAKIKFTYIEINNLLRAWVLLSVILGIYFFHSSFREFFSGSFYTADVFIKLGMIAFVVLVSLSAYLFTAKVVAHRFKENALFEWQPFMLFLSLIFAFFGIIFIIPFRTVILTIDQRKWNIFSTTSALMGITLSTIFLGIAIVSYSTSAFWFNFGLIGFAINIFLVLFTQFAMNFVHIWRQSKLVFLIILFLIIELLIVWYTYFRGTLLV